ncbi:MAG: hypothetical protein OXQ94_14230 [Gemmatimonadota bacterium]|nr:hypothetical protein [Gemmatimonadota bacterium]MDE2872834.1 hypothetical protein [Gemmatimonadota bacterium]
MGPVFTREQVAAIESGLTSAREAANADSDPDRGPLPVGGQFTGEPLFDAASGGTGGYNAFFIDSGDRVAVFNGEPRTSLVVDPADGRVPPLGEEGRERFSERRRLARRFGAFDNPENRPLGERCIMSFGSNAGPPMLPNYFYNNNYTIVQTPDHIVIMTEMVHDVRIIRMGEPKRLPKHVRPWMGDSWGRWEGDTLVVETTNLHPDQTLQGVPPSEEMRVTERFTRVGEDTINYEFTVDDPLMWTRPWSGDAGGKRGRGGVAPPRRPPEGATVEDEGVDAGRDQHEDLDAEEEVVVVAERLGVEEEEAGDGHDDEAHAGPGKKASREGPHGDALEGEADEAQVHHDRCAHEEAEGEHVGGLDQRPCVERLQERHAPLRLPQPPQEAPDHGTSRPSPAPSPAAESARSLGRSVPAA